MSTSLLQWMGKSLVVAWAAVLLGACVDDGALGPDRRPPLSAPLAASPILGGAFDARDVDLGSCSNLQVPAESKLSSRLYAEGVQIYRWNGASWTFVAPQARLFADANGNSKVGSHYGGPTWESASGSLVRAAVIDRCSADPTAVPWLLLGATFEAGPGLFAGTTHIQRVNTVGGLAPSAPGSFVGEEHDIPYTAEYLFYRAK